MSTRPLMVTLLTMAIMVLFGAAMGAAPAPPPSPASVRATLREAAAALEAGSFVEAIEAYDAVRPAFPMTPQIPYNMGVAAYRLGDHERAAKLFQDALDLAGDPALRARSAYNLGTNAYARALQTPDGGDAAAADLDTAKKELARALDHHRAAIAHDPADLDARANAELTQRLIKQLESMTPPTESSPSGEESPEDQSESGKPSEGSSGEQSGAPESTDQSAPSEPSQGEAGEPQDDASQSESEPQTSPESESDSSETQSEASQTSEPEGESQDPSEPSSAAPTDETPAGEAEGEPRGERMTRAEAERLLQAVRDRERQRQQDKARREAARRVPVEKDW